MEWLQLHRYTKQTENPPLSRIPLALIPYLWGMRIKHENSTALASGVAMFYGSGDYIDNVTKARLANLLFFWLLLTMTWVLSGGRKNPMVAVVATATAATVPAIVAHSGLATTDVPFVAAFLLAVWRWKTLLEHPASDERQHGWGSAVGTFTRNEIQHDPVPSACRQVALLFSYWWTGRLGRPVAIAVCAVARNAALAVIVSAVTIGASYGFRVATIGTGCQKHSGLTGRWRRPAGSQPFNMFDFLPNKFLHGGLFLQAHTKAGHLSYMLGQTSQARVSCFYYPVMLMVKTPIATIGFLPRGTFALTLRRRDQPEFVGYALGAVGLLLVATTRPINLGVRHILAIYPLLCIAVCLRASWALSTGSSNPGP